MPSKNPVRWTQQWREKNPREYQELLDTQDYGCGICGERTKDLIVDHDHETGDVRGLLCTSCNIRIGHWLDKWKKHYLKKMLTYLVRPPGRVLSGLPSKKRCALCNEVFPIEQFYIYRGRAHSYCRPCQSEYNRQSALRRTSGQ